MKAQTLLLLVFLASCNNNKSGIIKEVGHLPQKADEISGIAYSNNIIYAIEDGGNKNQLILLDTSGSITKTISLDNTKNIDWEDLTFDNAGNLYIGDFGNNENRRKDLAIYKIDSGNLHGKIANATYKISFDYPEQKEFRPGRNNLMFDVEAFFEYNNSFYLFTKNRGQGFNGSSYIYQIPNREGTHHAVLVGSLNTCNDYHKCAITSAAISPDGSKFVLLSHSKIWLCENFSVADLPNLKMIGLELNHFSQKEAVCFKNNDTLLIADERKKSTGGNLYEVSLQTLKKHHTLSSHKQR